MTSNPNTLLPIPIHPAPIIPDRRPPDALGVPRVPPGVPG
jgi:hypothetical protein